MRIALINVSGRLSSDGSRLISALLKRAGHSIKTVFLSRQNPLPYEPNEIEQLHEILNDVDLVMVAVYSTFVIRAVQITEFVHKKYPGMKVIWGGPHCISAPELSLPYADGVCFAEGDQAVVDLVNKVEAGANYLNTPNMAFNVNGSYVMNGVLQPISDLDSLPYPDYNLDNQFLLDRQLSELTKEKVQEYFVRYPFGMPTFYILTSRGCPHQCSYCNNCRYIAMFGRNPMRFRSVDNFIGELEQTLEYLDFFTRVGFGDDDFLMRPTRQLEEFAEKYKKKIRLPFLLTASANTYRKEKMEILLDAGLKVIQIGVQSGSQRVLDEVYDRKVKVTRTKDVVRQIEPYKNTHGLTLLLDFIIDNPYETKADIFHTYKYILDLPMHVRINVYVLAFFPGTPLYDRALQDGFIKPFNEKTFRSFSSSRIMYQKNYETFLVMLISFHLMRYVPRFILRTLGSRPVQGIASIFPKSFSAFLINIIRKIKRTSLQYVYLKHIIGRMRSSF